MENTAASDQISELPLGIVERILAGLPIRDAARTSILSSAWRYRWNSMPDLNFKYGLCYSADGFGRIVNRCLLLHRGPIRKFSVASMLRLGPEIDPWISFLSRHGIEELEFYCIGLEGFRFPSSLFDCKKLTNLELSYCKLDIPLTFVGFVSLKRLHLSMVEIDSNIESLISRSPSLESLSLMFLRSPDLVIRISAPTIKYLELHGQFKDIWLEALPALVHMDFGLDCSDLPSTQSERSLINFFGGASNLEKLTMRGFVTKYFKIGYDPDASSTMFNHLKFMELLSLDLDDVEQILGVLELLLSAKHLEKLVLQPVHTTAESLTVKLHEVCSDFWLKYPLEHGGFMKLKVIEMLCIVCVPTEVEFTKFILCNSPALEEMKVTCYGQRKAKAMNMFDKLLELPRASAQAAITFYYRGMKL